MRAIASPNIAFIKYWGKLPSRSDETRNLGTNDSLSMTLAHAQTETRVTRHERTEVMINGVVANEKDLAKVRTHIERICRHYGQPIVELRVESHNNFPQGTGIASSASAFAALTLAVVGEILGFEHAQKLLASDDPDLSRLARRGSGSACRSLQGGFVKWRGEYAQRMAAHWPLRDTIVIFSREHKKVTSSEGHEAAQSSPLFADRLKRLDARLKSVERAIEQRDLSELGPALEAEALELHAIAASGQPQAIYLTPQSREFVTRLGATPDRDYFFTLDAGPNVHVISERNITADLKQKLADWGLTAEIWEDQSGSGPKLYKI